VRGKVRAHNGQKKSSSLVNIIAKEKTDTYKKQDRRTKTRLSNKVKLPLAPPQYSTGKIRQ